MSISMKNLSDRITALENKINSGALGGWEKGGNSNGYWIKEKSTGVIIQWGGVNSSISEITQFSFPIPFTNDQSYSITGVINGQSWSPNSYKFYVYKVDKANFKMEHGGIGSKSVMWIAIGYLISDRILNYIYNSVNASFVRIARFFYELNKGGVMLNVD